MRRYHLVLVAVAAFSSYGVSKANSFMEMYWNTEIVPHVKSACTDEEIVIFSRSLGLYGGGVSINDVQKYVSQKCADRFEDVTNSMQRPQVPRYNW